MSLLTPEERGMGRIPLHPANRSDEDGLHHTLQDAPLSEPVDVSETSAEILSEEASSVHNGDIDTTRPAPSEQRNLSTGASRQQSCYQRSKQESKVLQKHLKRKPALMKLKSVANARVMSIASEESSFIDFYRRPKSSVKHSMVNKPLQIDIEFKAEEDFQKREDFANMVNPPERDMIIKKMFDGTKKEAKQEAYWEFRFDQVKEKQEYVEKHGNILGVVGAAGIGKTTLVKKWTLQALKEKKMFGNKPFFLYIMVRLIDFNTPMTFLQFLLHTMWVEEFKIVLENENESEILKAISKDTNVFLIVDGMDEAAFESFSTEVPAPLLDSKNKAEVYLKYLVGGKLLPRAKKIFTLRPAPLKYLNPSHRPRFIVQILPLTSRSKNNFAVKFCGPNYNTLYQTVKKNSNLFAYCCTPMSFKLILHYLVNNRATKFVSLTQVLAYSSAHLKIQQGMYSSLVKLAWNRFNKNKVAFDAGIEDSTAQDESTKVEREGNKLKEFSHVIWQSFFPALYLMMVMPLQEFTEQLKFFVDDSWEVVARFAFGICNRSVFEDLKNVVSRCSHEDWNEKKMLLMTLSSSTTKEPIQKAILRSCSWAYESNDEEITSSISSSLPETLDFSNTSLLQADLESLSYTIEKRCKSLKKLDLSDNKMGEQGAVLIGNCIHNMEKVDLSKCDLKSSCAQVLSKRVGELNEPLKRLKLRGNTFGDLGADFIGNCIYNMEEVDLSACGLTNRGAEHLSKKIRELIEPLKKLNLQNNWIDDRGAASIGNCIHNVEEVDLGICGLTSLGADSISQKIIKLKEPLKILSLSGNNIQDEGAVFIGNCIHNIEQVDLNWCNLTSSGVKYLSKKIKELKKPVKSLCLSHNRLTDKSAESLAACVHNIERLDAQLNHFTEAGKNLIRSKSRGQVVF